jgi:hypothetical protein
MFYNIGHRSNVSASVPSGTNPSAAVPSGINPSASVPAGTNPESSGPVSNGYGFSGMPSPDIVQLRLGMLQQTFPNKVAIFVKHKNKMVQRILI